MVSLVSAWLTSCCRSTLQLFSDVFFFFPPVFPLYRLAGYNNLEVAEYLLEHGADVNAQDKGGLIPLHNAASYGVRITTTRVPAKYFQVFTAQSVEREKK